MKRTFLLTISLIFFSLQMIAQMNISTNLREDMMYDEELEDWLVLGTDEESVTFFEFNEELTIFKHTTFSITSSYIIKSQEEDEETGELRFSVISDVGNKYLMIIDTKEELLRFVYERDETLYSVVHHIKKVWFDE